MIISLVSRGPRVRTPWLGAVLALVVSAIALGAQAPARDRHVVLVSLDGFAARALDDGRLPVPTIRRLQREGVSARSLQPVNPTVTWPNHTSMVTGVSPAVHGVLYNGLLVRPEGRPPRVEPWRDKREMVRVRTLYDAAFEAGLTTAQVDWVAIQNPGTITWAFGERPDPASPVARSLVERGVLTAQEVSTFGVGSSAAWRDQAWTAAAVHIVDELRPNLLLYHLLALDDAQHRNGPGTREAYTAMAFVDAQLARVIEAVERSPVRDRTTVVVVSDHGFRGAEKAIRPNAVLRQLGLVTGQSIEIRSAAWAVTSGGTASVYVTDPSRRDEVLPRIRAALAATEGVERVMEPDEFSRLGWPTPSDSSQAGELVLVAKDGYEFSREDVGDAVGPVDPTHRGHHGVLAADSRMDAIFIAWGAGVRAGGRIDQVRTIDIAPTIAEWLGVRLEGMQGASVAAALR